jgi:hypothetical protein
MRSVTVDAWGLYEAFVRRDWGTLSPAQRLLVAFGELRTEVNNGGFDQYFFNSAGDHATEALTAARAAQADDVADLLERAMASLVGGYKGDRDERQAVLIDDTAEGAFEQLDSKYFALEESVDLDSAMNCLAERA